MALAKKKTVDEAKAAGAGAVKFQSRSTVGPPYERRPRQTLHFAARVCSNLWRATATNSNFRFEQYQVLKKYCEEKDILFFAKRVGPPFSRLNGKSSALMRIKFLPADPYESASS